jgi:hypothetical protein
MVTYELSETELVRLRAGLRIMALQRLGDAELAEEIAQESVTRVVQAFREGRLREPGSGQPIMVARVRSPSTAIPFRIAVPPEGMTGLIGLVGGNREL